MTLVVFRAKRGEDGLREGEAGWEILVDGELIEEVDNDDMDISTESFKLLWERLGIDLKFDAE